ncbi:MAG: glycosyltransferase family 4 protein [Candidatus Korobacteraceae bacterium]
MPNGGKVYLHVWTGDRARARALATQRYPDAQIEELSHRALREGGWKGQIQALRALRGRALVVYFESFTDSKQTELIRWSGLLHRCYETSMVNSVAEWHVYRRRDWLWMVPKTAFSLCADACVFLFWLAYLQFLKFTIKPVAKQQPGTFDVAYLFPYPLNAVIAGGAVSHIRGFLGGLAANGDTCRIFSGVSLPVDTYPTKLIPVRRKAYIFWESSMLSYNFRFAREVQARLVQQKPSVLYQRHGRFSVAGVVLARRLGVPLILEYNGSEIWMADYWDPTRFRTWLRMCEEVMLKCASLIVVVSEPLKEELLARGIPPERVLVNPNGVDPEYFHPACGGEEIRKELGLTQQEIVVEFVGTFSHWHGIAVLQEAIVQLLQSNERSRLRFLLIGEGPLHGEMRELLKTHEASGRVIFTGLISHAKVRAYLDAADILVSPHVPMPDGRPFFGSPTKLFEYMSIGKAIAASKLDQLAKVLSHGDTAILFEPGNVDQFVAAVRLLACDPNLRESLGRRAREAAIAKHTWARNASNTLTAINSGTAERHTEFLGRRFPLASERQ